MDGSGLNPGMMGFRKLFLSAISSHEERFAVSDIVKPRENTLRVGCFLQSSLKVIPKPQFSARLMTY